MREKQTALRFNRVRQPMPHRGIGLTALYDLERAAQHMLSILYREQLQSSEPIFAKNKAAKTDRNQSIRNRYNNGESVTKLAKEFNISEQRIRQIIHGKRK